jgi:hypothetical protein
LPHATAPHHDGPDTREVVFATYLPDVPRNRSYAASQLTNYYHRRLPPDFAKGQNEQKEDEIHDFSALGRCLMGIEPWPQDDAECMEMVDVGRH